MQVLPDGRVLKDSWDILNFCLPLSEGQQEDAALLQTLDSKLGVRARQLCYYHAFESPQIFSGMLKQGGGWGSRFLVWAVGEENLVKNMRKLMSVDAKGATEAAE